MSISCLGGQKVQLIFPKLIVPKFCNLKLPDDAEHSSDPKTSNILAEQASFGPSKESPPLQSAMTLLPSLLC